jgi:hypothetical protein
MGDQDKMGCMAKDWDNFIRVDDEDKEVKPKIVGIAPPSKEDLMKVLEDMIEKIEAMPQQAMSVSINHYDLLSVFYWMRAMFSLEPEKRE